MGAPHVFHHVPKPIAVAEFRDAVQAICRPRFPMVRFARPRNTALAISGGVDSMALAFLFSNLLKTFRGLQIADNPSDSAIAVIVDHRLRENSTQEASEVEQQVRRLGLRVYPRAINWSIELGKGVDPASLPNLESRARTLRYQNMALVCNQMKATSLFFAHHRDDQYETILMRLLAGAGYRGLRGIRAANAIPECYTVHGAYKSGLLDDQQQKNPYLSFKPTNKTLKHMRAFFKNEYLTEPRDSSYARACDNLFDSVSHSPGEMTRQIHPHVPYLSPLSIEDGGIDIYRPLLEFDKQRLIATCEANHIKWFEDATNSDPTLTTRNAIRHLVRNHELPHALQKPAILALADRSRRRVWSEEAEALRLLRREAVIQDFDPNAGTLLAELPSFKANSSRPGRLHARLRKDTRLPRQRVIAALVIRQLIAFVTPEHHLPQLTSLDNIVQRLFPQLFPDKSLIAPTTFSIASVIFDPVVGLSTTKWFLSRAPYPSTQPPPMITLPGYVLPGKLNKSKPPVLEPTSRHAGWHSWKTKKLWDGRFWIQISTCVNSRFQLRPYQPVHGKAFRKALPQKQRARLERILKYYAPGKVRTTLPAIYGLEWASANGLSGGGGGSGGGGRQASDVRDPTLILLALPTLGIQVPGLERWIKYDVSYRNVDVSLLGLSRKGDAAPLLRGGTASSASRRRRRGRLREYKGRGRRDVSSAL